MWGRRKSPGGINHEGANPAPGASASAAGSETSGRFRTADARRAGLCCRPRSIRSCNSGAITIRHPGRPSEQGYFAFAIRDGVGLLLPVARHSDTAEQSHRVMRITARRSIARDRALLFFASCCRPRPRFARTSAGCARRLVLHCQRGVPSCGRHPLLKHPEKWRTHVPDRQCS
jgi:hypothetical protein